MNSEVPSIILTAWGALRARLLEDRPRRRPRNPRRILVAPDLRLGDAILVTPLIAKLRAQYPKAEIVVVSTMPMLPLYQSRPYGITVWPYHPRRPATITAMLKRRGFDLAIVPGDNKHGWLARALSAKWVVAHAGDRPGAKNWPIDELIDYPERPMAVAEIFADLVAGPEPAPYRVGDWPAPAFSPFDAPGVPYVALHVGASTRLRHWPGENWLGLAQCLAARGLEVVWSGGPGEDSLVRAIDPQGLYRSYAGQLDLAQMWQLIAGASAFVSPDTGVAHLARLTGTPAISLFGPGSVTLFGRGRFWRNVPCAELTIADFPCRDGDEIFKRQRSWIRHCARPESACRMNAACMARIGVEDVAAAIERLCSPPLSATERDMAGRVPPSHRVSIGASQGPSGSEHAIQSDSGRLDTL